MQKLSSRSMLGLSLVALFSLAGCQTTTTPSVDNPAPAGEATLKPTAATSPPSPTPFPYEPYLTLDAAAGPVTEVVFSPDGQWIAGVAHREAVHIWQVSDGALQTTIQTSDIVDTLAFSPDGRLLAGTLWDAQAIGLWNTSDGALLAKINLNAPASGIDFAPDGASLAAGLWNGVIEIHAVSDGALLSSFTGAQNPITSVDFSRDGSLLATAAADGVSLWRIADQAQLLNNEENTTQVALSPRGDILASGASNHSVHLWSLTDGSLQASLGRGASLGIAFWPDGSLLAFISANNVVDLWRTDDAALWFYFNTNTTLHDLDVSPTGDLIALGRSDGKIEILRFYPPD